MRALILSLAIASLLPLTASAADNTSARRYGTSEALSVQNARLGEVLMVRSVDIKSDKRLNAGSAIGAAVGYGAAQKIKGSYRSATRIAAGTVGAVAGTAIQNGVSKRRGVEIYVRDLSDSRQRVIAIVQSADLDVRQGDRVFLVGKGTRTRVVPVGGQR
jgi:outer membrane lipoprotein SlyB